MKAPPQSGRRAAERERTCGRTRIRGGAKLRLGAAALAIGLMAVAAHAQPKLPHTGKYVGAQNCKNCHEKAMSGGQWAAWSEMGHSKALETLATPEAKKVALAEGVTDPQNDETCTRCHLTEFGLRRSRMFRTFKPRLGVQCESCHGPGHEHFAIRLKAAASEDETVAATYTKVPQGETGMPKVKLCSGCHNSKSPTFKEFDCAERVEKILHPDPRRKRSKAEIIRSVCEGESH